jgi:carbon monoxide dehydrogenase subunit G
MGASAATVKIARPAAEVFPWLLDPDRRLQWVSGLVSSEQTGEGTYREVVQEHGQRLEATATVIRHEPPRALEIELRGRGFTARAVSQLRETDGGTTLSSSLDVQLGGLGRFAGGLVGRQTQRSLERSLARLKELLEAPRPEDAEEQPRSEHT